ncbi:MAG: 30S ribosomal protein S6 [candidate division WOR-3 bacterium]|nr:30S ribosomal protein S6 [candidate division WOR-3 bacterium]
MNSYELAMIVSPDLGEKDVQKLAQDTKELLAASGATAVSDEQVERRALAYPIKKHNEANYVYVNFSGPPSIPEKFRFEMRHREGLMRMAFVCKPVPKPPAEPVETAAPEPDYPTAAVTPNPEVTDA